MFETIDISNRKGNGFNDLIGTEDMVLSHLNFLSLLILLQENT